MGIYNLGGGGGAPELQAKEATPLITNVQQIILPDEGYDGLSKVTVNPMPTGTLKTPTVNSIGYVSSGVQTAGYFDTSATSGLQLSTQAAKTITPTTYSQTAVASGKYTTGAVTVAGDSDLVASNIRSGVNIFGVNGSYVGSPTLIQGTYITPDATTYTLTFSNSSPVNAIFAFYVDCIWQGSLSAGDFYKAYYVPLYTLEDASSATEFQPIPADGRRYVRYWEPQYKDVNLVGNQTVYVTASNNMIRIEIPSIGSNVQFKAKSTYRLFAWAY